MVKCATCGLPKRRKRVQGGLKRPLSAYQLHMKKWMSGYRKEGSADARAYFKAGVAAWKKTKKKSSTSNDEPATADDEN